MPNPPSSGLPNPASYDLSDRETVTDLVTGLMWERSSAQSIRVEEAAEHCARVTTSGYCDWRLPTRIELVSIVDFTRTTPAVDVEAFPGTEGDYLSASERDGYRWRIGTDGGTRQFSPSQAPTGAVRCVRSDEASAVPEPHYTFAGESPNDIAHDRATGLVWQRRIGSATFTFSESESHCASLALDGGGFRVPSMKELQTLIDETSGANPPLDSQAFPDSITTVNPTFWTSSPSARSSDNAWFVRGGMALQSAVDADLSAKFYVRCVK
jgi:hypothetical protein